MHLTPDWMRVRHIYLHTAAWKPFWVHLRMCICVSERDPPGFRSKQFSVNLIDRETPSPSPSSAFFTIYHPFFIFPPFLLNTFLRSFYKFSPLPARYTFSRSVVALLFSVVPVLVSSLLFATLHHPPSILSHPWWYKHIILPAPWSHYLW